ncbi:nitrate/nitrite transport system substrate-binding protein [Paraburkholderia eburnea]|uniref:Nitrate/nitrite transport system substrate-binding protein n=1 Tax=Paraburkholderia eburnea TaxID=1189126 RepID=A0A2S4M5Y3_9BURK|nr:CmpA/NrtA family ABC transporter substrate-binding protein [Paraburkholderia eburnea]POR50136.1 nitrate/nitrite transport system substrate-binding protein [Paraburkholderia eburnea]PRZ20583.1 nitrate/nitrite transport system substrate-binding protein [Paraburkholderia eburnea]
MNESRHAAAPPEKTHLKIGFVPLADAAPVVAAKLLEFGHAHGLTLELSRQPSWAALRDKLLAGELDAAHSLYGLVYGVQLGIGGPQTDMAVLMVLNRNGQAISLSNRLADALAQHGTLPRALGRKPVFAQTFPTGTHAMWLYYWLAAQGVHPLRDIESVVIPPPQMVAALAEERLDGLCVGEPWPTLAQRRGMGRTVVRSGEIWPDHPEKVLACRRDFVERYPNTARALVQTMLEACRWLDGAGHRAEIAQWLARPEMLGADADLIASVLEGETGLGTPDMKFFEDGAVNYPLESEGIWFLTQFERWGMMARREDYQAIAQALNQTTLYRQAAAAIGVKVPMVSPKPVFIDGRAWDGENAAAYVEGFPLKA